MKKVVLNVNYLVDCVLTVIPTNTFYEEAYAEINDEEIPHAHFEIDIGKVNIKSDLFYSIEYAFKNLQKSLPTNITIACCQSCRYGNFCPYGNIDNEIYCFKDTVIKSKSDLCDYFSSDSEFCEERIKKLLDFCAEYKPISDDKYYTYNDWMF